MKITGIETVQTPRYSNLLWVRLLTDEGPVGLGETFRNPQAIVAYIHETCAPYLIGRDPGRINEHADNLLNWTSNRYIGYPTRSVEFRGNSAIDIALWDLKSKAAGLSLADMLGGPCRDSIPVYNTCAGQGYNWNSSSLSRLVSAGGESRADKSVPDDLEAQINRPGELAQSLLDEGITAMKVWPFDEAAYETRGQRISAERMKEALGRLESIRKAVGDKIDIMLEYHALWQMAPALNIARHVDAFDVFWHEDPLNMAQISDLAEYRAKAIAPVAGSEALGTAIWYRDALAANAIDYMHYDIAWIGGITEALRIAGLAHAHNRMMCPHDCTGPVTWIANLHMSMAFPTAMILESVRAYYLGFYRDLVTQLPVIKQGQAYPMTDPGLGTELSPALLADEDTIIRTTTARDL
ncbi:MAG: mandelate racemase/muconate lactonizing enzyme family protein [Rhodospirillales bacterium]|nr:mandelate racemase/muconate lactonizing enzyme family protein [Rhodospirillales bacterium]